MYKFGTWNMQGGTGDGESKWVLAYGLVSTNQLQCLCLQECGEFPYAAIMRADADNKISSGYSEYFKSRGKRIRTSNGSERKSVEYFRWSTTRSGRQTFGLYYLAWDTNGTRVNYAILVNGSVVTNPETDLLPLAEGAGFGRPAFGIHVLDCDIYTFHALSGSGNDINGVLKTITANRDDDLPENQAGMKAFVFGDFNRRYEKDMPYVGWTSMDPGGRTFSTARPRKRFDYGFNNFGLKKYKSVVVRSVTASDHFPVIFEIS